MLLSGQLAPTLLATIPGTSRLIRTDLVGGVVALRAAFLARFGKPLIVTDGYRAYSDGTPYSQVAIFRARYQTAPLINRPVRWWNGAPWYQRPGTAPAGVPGTSNHGWGRALDLGSGVNSSLTSTEYLWMRANAHRFGWTHPAWARQAGSLEPWHWEGIPVAAYVNNPVGGGGSITPTPIGTLPAPLTPEDDMPLNAADLSEINAVVYRLLKEPEIVALTATAVAEQIKKADLGSVARDAVLAIFREDEIAGIIRANTAPTTGGVAIDYAALARAVADEQARRLAS